MASRRCEFSCEPVEQDELNLNDQPITNFFLV